MGDPGAGQDHDVAIAGELHQLSVHRTTWRGQAQSRITERSSPSRARDSDPTDGDGEVRGREHLLGDRDAGPSTRTAAIAASRVGQRRCGR